MKRFVNLLAVCLLVVFAYLVYRLPSTMMMIESNGHSTGEGQPVETVVVTASSVNIWAMDGSATGESQPVETVTVTASSVNIRAMDGSATGEYAHFGDIITVQWLNDERGMIVSPQKWAGKTIWRGCTSKPEKLGCSQK